MCKERLISDADYAIVKNLSYGCDSVGRFSLDVNLGAVLVWCDLSSWEDISYTICNIYLSKRISSHLLCGIEEAEGVASCEFGHNYHIICKLAGSFFDKGEVLNNILHMIRDYFSND